MRYVGFPLGITTDAEKIRAQLADQSGSLLDSVLLATLKGGGQSIGECLLGSPDAEGAARTDIKLLPQYWSQGYGREIKIALLDYLFTHTTCRMVLATPNRLNIASIKLQESVGGRKMGEGVYQFPEALRENTTDVPYIEYEVFRGDWERRSCSAASRWMYIVIKGTCDSVHDKAQ